MIPKNLIKWLQLFINKILQAFIKRDTTVCISGATIRNFGLFFQIQNENLKEKYILYKFLHFWHLKSHILVNINNVLTLPSEALAPTLSPLEFQHTSKIPPVPL